jgi:hypothetical protein
MSMDGQEETLASATSDAHHQQSAASNEASVDVGQDAETIKSKTSSVDGGVSAVEGAANEGGNASADAAMDDSPAVSRTRKRKSAVEAPVESTDSPVTRRTRTAVASEANASNETPPSKKSKTTAKSPMVFRP